MMVVTIFKNRFSRGLTQDLQVLRLLWSFLFGLPRRRRRARVVIRSYRYSSCCGRSSGRLLIQLFQSRRM